MQCNSTGKRKQSLQCSSSTASEKGDKEIDKKLRRLRLCKFVSQSTYFTVRGQSYFSRLPKYWPPIPLSARRVCPPPATKAGGTHSPSGEGDGGSIFWKTREIGMPSYSKICTLWFVFTIGGRPSNYFRLKVPSGQIGSKWEWYHWKALEKDINRYKFLIFYFRSWIF